MKILLPTDGSPNALRAVHYVIKLARQGLSIDLTLLSVIPLTEDVAVFLGISKEEYLRLSQLRVNPTFEHYRELFSNINNIQTSYLILQGDPAEEIVKLAETDRYDAIVIGSRGLSPVKELFLGSVSHKVVQMAKCPVVIVK
ncbi:universal stress protein [Desulforamulus hydrothermalis]|uniref:UspA domain protein n=1 Tax=Desulforamulus hydrothermalis Lam5 = DSM 18033 TaxID=1121428 RepID=K8DZ71_9FIRM|nr:universal stress protein [Desulforamulus hydrothermalis]CCO08294.1 UspA domain protein [Desulforamulus hydrothermalis Lam5 = DSM 18033]SHH37952.1 Nucleotide-binding universal stress protein, UspA family [Desulforamulus hydrothermalis Lam5 = DSM 18033]